MEALVILCCSSGLLAIAATFLWARLSNRRVRLYSAVVMGPSVALLSGVVFHIGAFVYHALQGIQPLGLIAPSQAWGFAEWLRYSCISMIIPLLLAILLLVIAVIVNGMGADDVITLWDGFDTLTSGPWLPDALGCVALGSLLLGMIPYGIFYAIFGFLLSAIAREAGDEVMRMQDPLALLAMMALVWTASLISALKTAAPDQQAQA